MGESSAKKLLFKASGRVQELCLPFVNGICTVDSSMLSTVFNYDINTLCVVQVKNINDPSSLRNVIEEDYKSKSDRKFVIYEEFGDTVMVYGGKEQSKPIVVIAVDSPSSSSLDSVRPCDSTFQKILRCTGKSKLKKICMEVKESVKVDSLPPFYNGKIVYELPPQKDSAGSMDGMQQSLDPHKWTNPSHTNGFKSCMQGTVRLAYCVGHLECQNPCCDYVLGRGQANSIQWSGSLGTRPNVGPTSEEQGSLHCAFCKEQPICIARCDVMIYYCLPSCITNTRLVVHTGTHTHPIRRAESKEDIRRLHSSLQNMPVSSIGKFGPKQMQNELAMQLVIADVLSTSEVDQIEMLTTDKVEELLDRLEPLCNQRRLRKWIDDARKKNKQYADDYNNIMYLKSKCRYEYFHGSKFPYQTHDKTNDRCYIFKMSTVGPGSGVDLVNRMRPGQDLGNSWVHFDHVKRIHGWTTLACHVYDPILRSLVTIAICDMKTEDAQSQRKFWKKLNKVMISKGYEPAQFHGFMADEAQANWIAVRDVFFEGKEVCEKERSCVFHFEQCMQRQAKKHLSPEYRNEFIKLCREWRNSDNPNELYLYMTGWLLEKASASNVNALCSWMAWWHQRVSRWGNYMKACASIEDAMHIPDTNLSESRHASWLAGTGYKKTLTLYDANLFDLTEAILQSSKYKSHLDHNFVGSGPGISTLFSRLQGRLSSGVKSKEVTDAVTQEVSRQGLPVFECGSGGNDQTISKRKCMNFSTPAGEFGTHRPDKQARNIPRVAETDPIVRNLFGSNSINVSEREISDTNWAIRRTNAGSKVRCQGRVSVNGKKCDKLINKGLSSIAAPSYYGIRSYRGGTCEQFFWFCPDNYRCTWYPNADMISTPNRPVLWPVHKGVKLKPQELETLERGGYNLEGLSRTTYVHQTEDVQYVSSPGSQHSVMRRDGKRVNRRTKLSRVAELNLEQSKDMDVSVVSNVIVHKRHVEFSLNRNGNAYIVSIKKEPSCTCPDYQKRVAKGSFIPCKHMFYIFQSELHRDPSIDMSLLQPVFSDELLDSLLHTF